MCVRVRVCVWWSGLINPNATLRTTSWASPNFLPLVSCTTRYRPVCRTLSAHANPPTLCLSVSAHMLSQVTLISTGELAVRAAERLLSSVNAHMPGQVTLLSTGELAVRTAERLLSSVSAPHPSHRVVFTLFVLLLQQRKKEKERGLG